MRKGITQKEMARRLGVSQALVSRALSGTADSIDASPVTVAKIRRAAATWNYAPNAAALTLKGAPSRTLAVIVKNFEDPFFGHMIRVLQGLVREQGYALLLAGWEEEDGGPENEPVLRKYEPDGLLVCGSDYSPPAVKHFLAEGRPVVQIGLGQALSGVRQVAMDEEAGVKSLVDYLTDQGHTRIGFMGDMTFPQRRREALLLAALEARHLTVPPEWFVRLEACDQAPVSAAVARLLAPGQAERPGVVVAADDALAQRLLRALHEHGVRVPEDISLAGIDDIPTAATMIPSLTSVRQPVEEMVRQAFLMVTGEGGGEARAVVVPPSLSVRESCSRVA